MINKIKQWSILLYVMLLINIALVVWIVVYNNSYVIVNNIDIWNNQEEVFANIYDKANIALDSVKKYNSNWGWYVDWLSCPTNVTMSWSQYRKENIPTTLIEKYWEIYCEWIYDQNPSYEDRVFRIYYDDVIEDFDTSTYWINPWYHDSVSIEQTVGTNIELSTTNLAAEGSTSVTTSTAYPGYPSSNLNDENHSSQYIANTPWASGYVRFDFWRELKVWKIIISKNSRHWIDWSYWSWGRIDFKDRWWNIDYWKRIHLPNMRNKSSYEESMSYNWLIEETRYLELISYSWYMDILEFEIYELLSDGTEEIWEWSRPFYDTDQTFISFNTDGIHWDGIDDDLNSDNYMVTSKDNLYFPNGYQDDDVVPRKTVFGSIPAQSPYQHVYWNNHKTLKVIEENTNNNDILNMKMWDVDQAHVFLNTFNTENLDYNIKILEFDRNIYRDNFTLLPLASYEWKNISDYLGYIQLNSWDNSLSIAKEITTNEFKFDFQSKDYAIFIANNSESLLAYHLESYTPTWSWIYINPINDSGTGTISVLANHIIIWWEKNFIWENFEVVWIK